MRCVPWIPRAAPQPESAAIWTCRADQLTDRTASGSRSPLRVTNPSSVWYTAGANGRLAQRRHGRRGQPVPEAAGLRTRLREPAGTLVGIFDPAKDQGIRPAVPGTARRRISRTRYCPANAASRAALRGARLLPNLNLGGYVSQPAT